MAILIRSLRRFCWSKISKLLRRPGRILIVFTRFCYRNLIWTSQRLCNPDRPLIFMTAMIDADVVFFQQPISLTLVLDHHES